MVKETIAIEINKETVLLFYFMTVQIIVATYVPEPELMS